MKGYLPVTVIKDLTEDQLSGEIKRLKKDNSIRIFLPSFFIGIGLIMISFAPFLHIIFPYSKSGYSFSIISFIVAIICLAVVPLLLVVLILTIAYRYLLPNFYNWNIVASVAEHKSKAWITDAKKGALAGFLAGLVGTVGAVSVVKKIPDSEQDKKRNELFLKGLTNNVEEVERLSQQWYLEKSIIKWIIITSLPLILVYWFNRIS